MNDGLFSFKKNISRRTWSCGGNAYISIDRSLLRHRAALFNATCNSDGRTRSPVQLQVGTPSATQIDGKTIRFSLLTPDQFAKLTRQQLAGLAESGQPIGIEFNPGDSIDAIRQDPQPFVYTDTKGRNFSAYFGMAVLHIGEKFMLVIPIPSGTPGGSNTTADIASYSIDPSGTKFVAVGFLQPALPGATNYVELFNRSQPLKENRIKHRDVNPNTVMFIVASAYQVGR